MVDILLNKLLLPLIRFSWLITFFLLLEGKLFFAFMVIPFFNKTAEAVLISFQMVIDYLIEPFIGGLLQFIVYPILRIVGIIGLLSLIIIEQLRKRLIWPIMKFIWYLASPIVMPVFEYFIWPILSFTVNHLILPVFAIVSIFTVITLWWMFAEILWPIVKLIWTYLLFPAIKFIWVEFVFPLLKVIWWVVKTVSILLWENLVSPILDFLKFVYGVIKPYWVRIPFVNQVLIPVYFGVVWPWIEEYIIHGFIVNAILIVFIMFEEIILSPLRKVRVLFIEKFIKKLSPYATIGLFGGLKTSEGLMKFGLIIFKDSPTILTTIFVLDGLFGFISLQILIHGKENLKEFRFYRVGAIYVYRVKRDFKKKPVYMKIQTRVEKIKKKVITIKELIADRLKTFKIKIFGEEEGTISKLTKKRIKAYMAKKREERAAKRKGEELAETFA